MKTSFYVQIFDVKPNADRSRGDMPRAKCQ